MSTTNKTVSDFEAVPASSENVFEKRSTLFERVYNYLNANAPEYLNDHKPSPSLARHDNNEQALVTLLENGVFPWERSTPVTEYSETHTVRDLYRVQLFFKTCAEVVVENKLSKAETQERLEQVIENLDTFDGSDLPSDGSRGQAKAAMSARIAALNWLLGEQDE